MSDERKVAGPPRRRQATAAGLLNKPVLEPEPAAAEPEIPAAESGVLERAGQPPAAQNQGEAPAIADQPAPAYLTPAAAPAPAQGVPAAVDYSGYSQPPAAPVEQVTAPPASAVAPQTAQPPTLVKLTVRVRPDTRARLRAVYHNTQAIERDPSLEQLIEKLIIAECERRERAYNRGSRYGGGDAPMIPGPKPQL
ncbi:hypothetical protein ACFVAJ_16800 [Agromyces sp. NPDC057679]|uniref:hypothetical protein n=1 Tax=Agromyces sp. NPDC057679 TaxID=3346207 RepID=UPI00366F32E7